MLKCDALKRIIQKCLRVWNVETRYDIAAKCDVRRPSQRMREEVTRKKINNKILFNKSSTAHDGEC